MSIADEISKLKELLDSGVLTQEEFEEQKARILAAQPQQNAPRQVFQAPSPQPYPSVPASPPQKKKKKVGCIVVPVLLLVLGLIIAIALSQGGGGDGPTVQANASVAQKTTKAPTVQDLAIDSLSVKEDIIGQNEITFRVRNSGGGVIDAYDVVVKCFNNYGEPVNSPGSNLKIDNEFSGTASDVSIASGESDSAKWVLHFFDTATNFEAAITRYHIKGGEAVVVPESELVWKSVKK